MREQQADDRQHGNRRVADDMIVSRADVVVAVRCCLCVVVIVLVFVLVTMAVSVVMTVVVMVAGERAA
jgi:hypothetical protein